MRRNENDRDSPFLIVLKSYFLICNFIQVQSWGKPHDFSKQDLNIQFSVPPEELKFHPIARITGLDEQDQRYAGVSLHLS